MGSVGFISWAYMKAKAQTESEYGSEYSEFGKSMSPTIQHLALGK
jgi:hypothetical protein